MKSDVNVTVKVRLVSRYNSQDHEIRHRKWNMILDVLRSVNTFLYDLDLSMLNNEYRAICSRYMFQRSNPCIYLSNDLRLSHAV